MTSGMFASNAVNLLLLNGKTQSGVLTPVEIAGEIEHTTAKVLNALKKDLRNQGLLIVNP